MQLYTNFSIILSNTVHADVNNSSKVTNHPIHQSPRHPWFPEVEGHHPYPPVYQSWLTLATQQKSIF